MILISLSYFLDKTSIVSKNKTQPVCKDEIFNWLVQNYANQRDAGWRCPKELLVVLIAIIR